MGWVTLDDGQHVYIGAGGEFQPRGPTGPKGPSLREQAAAHRAGKGPAETRRAELLTRAKEAFHKHGEKGPDTERAARLKGGTKKDQAEAKRIEKSYPQHQKEQDILRGRLKPLGHKTLKEQAEQGKPADRVHEPGPGGMARTASGINLHERMTASATAASTRAAAAKARGDRPAELAAHEHRALILAKQNDIKGVHKSQFGYQRTAPAGEKTAAAALVARVRGGGKAAEPAKPAGPRGINAAFKASATPAEVRAVAQQRLAGREGMNRLRIAQGKARVGDYVQAPSGSVNVRRPALAEGRVVAKSAEGVLTLKRGDEKTFKVHAAEAQPVGAGQRRFTPERATKAAELRAGRAPAAPARPAAPSLREQAAAAREAKITDVMTRSAMTDRLRSNGLTGVTDAQKRVVRAVDLKTLNAGRLTAAIRQKDKPAIARYKAREASLGGLVRNLQGKAK